MGESSSRSEDGRGGGGGGERWWFRGPLLQPHPGRVYMWLGILMNSKSLRAACCWGRPDDLEAYEGRGWTIGEEGDGEEG